MAKKKSNAVKEAEYEEIEKKEKSKSKSANKKAKKIEDDDYLEDEIEEIEVAEDETEDVEDETEDEVEEEEVEKEPLKKHMGDKARMIILGIIAVALLAVIILFAVIDSKSDDKSKNNTNAASEVKAKKDRNTSTDFLKELYSVVDNKNIRVIFFESATCGYCTMEKPIIANIAKDYDMDYFDIDASKLSDDELTEIVETFGIQGATPTTIITQAGKIVAVNEGYLDGKELVKFFSSNGVIESNAVYNQEADLTEINYEEFKKISKEDKVNVILLDTAACGTCNTVREILNGIAKDKKVKVYHMAAANLSEDDVNDLVGRKLKDMGYDEAKFKSEGQVSVPLTLIVKKNKIRKYILDKTEKSDYTEVLKEYNFIK